jgi:NAD(P)-dependent dehydrogenase (short-subunit alcohol dehydrogenase family)
VEEFAGKTAIVTGAGSGMGKAFALRWAAEGMNVVIGDIQQDALDATAAELEASGAPVAALRIDVSKLSDIEALADLAESRFGKIHLVHNNAGVEGYLDGKIWEASAKDWDWTLSVNLMSVIYGIRTFVPRILAHGEEGHVVNTCSMTSVIAAGNMYGICKHAILAMTEVLNADLEAAGASVAATGLCPGIIATNLFHGSRNRQAALSNDGGMSASGSELRDHMHSVLSKGMPPAEVANLVVTAVREKKPYLLTDHEWDSRVVARHEAILAGAVGPAATGALDAEGVR